MLYLYQGGDNISECGGFFMVWLTKSKFLSLGHCLPIVIAGSSTAAVKKLLENSTWNGAGMWFRKLAGTTIAILGGYFIVTPFFN